MKFSIKKTQFEKLKNICLIVGIFEDGILSNGAAYIDKLTHHALSKLISGGTFTGKVGQCLPLLNLGAAPAFTCVLLVGCGKEKKLTSMVFRNIIVNAMKSLNMLSMHQAVCYLTELKIPERSLNWKIKQIIEATHDAFYRFDLFKSTKEPAVVLKELILHTDTDETDKALQLAIDRGLAVASGVQLTKNLANSPSNICTPSFLAEQARALGKKYSSLKVKILDEEDMQKLGMGALLGVSRGSAEPAKLICLEYKGAKKNKPIALVGKGVTFDTGGNSLKPADSMVGMKYDMCGAASVFGTFEAVCQLNLPLNLVGIIPAVENMPGGTAYKPEDILTSLSGQTIEVISTDAEGRLALCDALTYCERYEPEIVIDIATLTGAVVIALGTHVSGLLSNHDKLAETLLKAGQESNDRAWQLPLFDEYQEQIKSPFADMANVGGRPAGVITAACFLSRFAAKFHWAHLDVAGTAAIMMGTQERRATGRPVPLLMQFLFDTLEKKPSA